MSQFSPLHAQELQAIAAKLESLNKSFSAGVPGLQNAGRTGTSALAIDSLDSVMRSITLMDEDFLLTKSIQQLPMKQSMYQYVLKTATRSGVDLWGTEAFLPQEDASQYMRVAEVLKVQGIRKTITQMAQLINDVGGYTVDLEAENDENASMAMAESLERALYVGCDYYMDSNGLIDGAIGANPNAPLRVIRGIQAQVREGNSSARGIPGDFVGYGNNRKTLFDNKGAILSRQITDKVVSAVRESRGRITEAHCTVDQLRHFRASFFPFERGDIGQSYAIRGADVSSEPKQGFSLKTSIGDVDFIPAVFKYNRAFVEPVTGSVASAPNTPSISSSAQAAAANAFKAGDVVNYVVQAASVNGMSNGSAVSAVTILVDGNKVSLTIAAQAGVEEFLIFRGNPGEAAGKEKFIGKAIAARSGATTFVDNQAVLPGLDCMVFLPKQQFRSKLGTLGNMLNKLNLGIKGTASETIYVSYLANILEYVRHHALLDNVFQELD